MTFSVVEGNESSQARSEDVALLYVERNEKLIKAMDHRRKRRTIWDFSRDYSNALLRESLNLLEEHSSAFHGAGNANKSRGILFSFTKVIPGHWFVNRDIHLKRRELIKKTQYPAIWS
ncbi:hypothetical protein BLNAU_15643 [Blattamonas nauphoetae]|uniref:Uncharacterized protein n=1 Tax=Blattamonas nauphoetae TaxID=2049346 RepID=A0ABQ9XA85_9EUKA|nr:hypothetical protein BLNAU_15643 [Blattamonas nauphoetae]